MTMSTDAARAADWTYERTLTYLVQSPLRREDRDLVVVVRVPRHGGGAIKGLAAPRRPLLWLLLPMFVAEINSRFPVQSLPCTCAIRTT